MSIVLITGDHPRHRFFVNELAKSGCVTGWIKEVREEFVPQPPDGLSRVLTDLYRKHFLLRQESEDLFFGANQRIDIPTLEVQRQDLNSADTVLFLKKCQAKVVISYGCHKIENKLMGAVDSVFWNTHGGLSPDYRGVITHFWPSYFLEPQMTGMTLHETTDHIDGGAIIHQTAAPMVRGDTLHRLAARAVLGYVQDLKMRIEQLDFDKLPQGQTQKYSGRVFRANEWRPEHLHLIYEVYEDKIVDLILDGQLTGRSPNLISVLS